MNKLSSFITFFVVLKYIFFACFYLAEHKETFVESICLSNHFQSFSDKNQKTSICTEPHLSNRQKQMIFKIVLKFSVLKIWNITLLESNHFNFKLLKTLFGLYHLKQIADLDKIKTMDRPCFSWYTSFWFTSYKNVILAKLVRSI
jgi:hypothetical protein